MREEKKNDSSRTFFQVVLRGVADVRRAARSHGTTLHGILTSQGRRVARYDAM